MDALNDPKRWMLEVLDRGGRVQQRLRVDQALLTLGRAPDNTIVLDDAFVDAHHAELRFDGAAVEVRDLGSLNGVWLGGREAKPSATLTSGQEIRLGHSHVRLRALSADVPPARRDTTARGPLAWLKKPVVLLAGLTLAALALVFDAWMAETRALNVGILVNELAYPLLFLLLWAGLWAGANRLTSHRANFSVHLAIGSLALAGVFLADPLAAILAFAFDWHTSFSGVLLLLEIAVMSLALFAHLQFVADGRRSLQALGAFAVSALLFGSPVLGDWLRRDEFMAQPMLMPLLLPPDFRQVDGRSVEAFVRDADKLRESVETSR
ncbi:MAG: FHA domain-containing protein [Xanthomonadales bacterium]|nr:FHA domain-containing protein [Xanthomonadales bacterium]